MHLEQFNAARTQHPRRIKFRNVISLQKNAIRGERINATITSLKRCLINPMFSQLHSRFLTRGVATLRCTYVAPARELCRFAVNVVIKFVFFVYMITLLERARVSTPCKVFLAESDAASRGFTCLSPCTVPGKIEKSPRAVNARIIGTVY